MHAGYDDDVVIVNAVKHSVWESGKQRPACVAMNYGVHSGMHGNAVENGLNRFEELATQSRTPLFVPKKGFFDIGGSRGANEDCQDARLRIW